MCRAFFLCLAIPLVALLPRFVRLINQLRLVWFTGRGNGV
jgi:hypothetical protein